MTAVEDVFGSARAQAFGHMEACERARLRWGETSITEIVMAQAALGVTVVPFTQSAEARSGADWVWWWVDGTSAYGMLVQAKRVTVTGTDWKFDFRYIAANATRSQHEVLRASAAALGLLPVYALYLGTGDYRGWEPCSDVHQEENCPGCAMRTVSLMPALLAEELIVVDAESTYERSVALEQLWTPPSTGALLIPALETKLAPELQDFLKNRQNGTRAVTRSMIDLVLRARYGAFSAASANVVALHDGKHDQLGSVFGAVPDDEGHWMLPYFKHTLEPLRHVPPAYVLDIAVGEFDEDQLESEMPDNVAGIAVVHLPHRG